MLTFDIDRLLKATGHVPQTFFKSCGVTNVTATRLRFFRSLMEVTRGDYKPFLSQRPIEKSPMGLGQGSEESKEARRCLRQQLSSPSSLPVRHSDTLSRSKSSEKGRRLVETQSYLHL